MTDGHQFPPALERSYPIVEGRIQTRSLEAHVVDHCNLTCAQCCSLSPHLPRWQVDAASFEYDLVRLARVVRPRVFKLVGGEPLLHPSLLDLVRAVRRSGIAPRISITTNGLLLARTSDALWAEIDAMTISVYPKPALDPSEVAAIRARAQQFEVALNWKRQTHFVVMTAEFRRDDAATTAAIFAECWLRERCHMVREGRFYMCTRPPHLQTYLGGTHDLWDDGIPLDPDLELRDRLMSYLHRQRPLEACSHCYGGSATMKPHRLLSRAELVRARR
jgi:GTP 3',8-cyclase